MLARAMIGRNPLEMSFCSAPADRHAQVELLEAAVVAQRAPLAQHAAATEGHAGAIQRLADEVLCDT